MTTPGAYPPGPMGQGSQGSQNVVIAAPPGDQLAEALAAELRAMGWNAAVAEQVAPYAREARACVALVTPTSLTSPALAAAFAAGAPLIPLVVGGAPLPPGPWAVPPLAFSGDPAQAARDIVTAANNLAGAPAPAPFAGGYAAPAGGATIPYAPAAPSQPLQPYQAMPAAPSQPFQPPYPGTPAYPTQPGYYTQYPQGGAPYVAPAAPKRRRWPMVVGAIVGVVLLLCVVGGVLAYANMKSFVGAVSTGVSQTETASAATATPEATATPSIPANFTLYTDSASGYSIAYPNSWQKSAGNSDVIFLDTSEAADLVVGSVDANIPQSEIKSTETQFFKSAAGSGTYNHLQGPTTVTYAGESWTQESADISSAGQTLHGVVLVANHGSRAYIIGYLGLKSSFASLDTQYYQPMLQSFSFTN